MWETIVLNLVSNAFKYTFRGSITVRVAPGRDGGIDLSVTDTGTSIAANLAPCAAVLPSVQLSPRSSAEETGIDLALLKGLVRVPGETKSTDSAPGAGTTAVTVTASLGQGPTPPQSSRASTAGGRAIPRADGGDHGQRVRR